MTIKVYSGQENSIDLLGSAGILTSTITFMSSLILSKGMQTSLIIGVSEPTDVFNYTNSLKRKADILSNLRVVNIIIRHSYNMLTLRGALIIIMFISLILRTPGLGIDKYF